MGKRGSERSDVTQLRKIGHSIASEKRDEPNGPIACRWLTCAISGLIGDNQI